MTDKKHTITATLRLAHGYNSDYAHPEVIVRVTEGDRMWSCDRHPLHELKLHAQIDSQQPEPYGIRFGYEPSTFIVEESEIERMSKGVRSIRRKLDRIASEAGPAYNFEAVVLRFLNVVKPHSCYLDFPGSMTDRSETTDYANAAFSLSGAIYRWNQKNGQKEDAA